MRKIDEWLQAEEFGEPFSHCIHCRLPLLELDRQWLVNKEFHRGECIMEYAICQTCRDEVSAGFSASSKRSVRKFLETEIAWDDRVMEFMLMSDLTRRFDACIACREERGNCDDYAISGLFDEGGRITVGPLPLMICGPCIGRMTAGLSDGSRELWRRFVSEHFAGPCEDPESLPGSGFPGLF